METHRERSDAEERRSSGGAGGAAEEQRGYLGQAVRGVHGGLERRRLAERVQVGWKLGIVLHRTRSPSWFSQSMLLQLTVTPPRK